MSRPAATLLALLLFVTLALAIAAETARGATLSRDFMSSRAQAIAALRHEFGEGWLFACMVRIADRETGGTFNTRAVNWDDRHADGSYGSFGLLQIGALWRRPGESTAGFARRMYDPAQNARLAHHILDVQGLSAWNGRC